MLNHICFSPHFKILFFLFFLRIPDFYSCNFCFFFYYQNLLESRNPCYSLLSWFRNSNSQFSVSTETLQTTSHSIIPPADSPWLLQKLTLCWPELGPLYNLFFMNSGCLFLCRIIFYSRRSGFAVVQP